MFDKFFTLKKNTFPQQNQHLIVWKFIFNSSMGWKRFLGSGIDWKTDTYSERNEQCLENVIEINRTNIIILKNVEYIGSFSNFDKNNDQIPVLKRLVCLSIDSSSWVITKKLGWVS